MRPRRVIALTVLCAAALAAGPATVAAADGSAPRPNGGASRPIGVDAPYEYLGWGNPQSPLRVMAATGIKQFTLAFMLSDGTCNPAWDGYRPLLGGVDEKTIDQIRDAGGDVVVSFGGWSGRKLGVVCKTGAALAGAYQKVIDAYQLKAIDIDIENTEMNHVGPRRRVAQAIAIVRAEDPSLRIFVTLGTGEDGPGAVGRDLIRRVAALGARVDAWTIMPFDFGVPVRNMGRVSITAAEGLKDMLMAAYHEPAGAAYRTMGISSMNGVTDESDEVVTLHDFRTMLAYAQAHHLARFTFWSVNRDRPCRAGLGADSCSSIAQAPFAFTTLVAGYGG